MKKALPLLLAFILGGIVFWSLGRLATVIGGWRTIQVIRTTDRSHTAELNRFYGYIDVMFEISLDGQSVYHSPDFAPADDRPFREWITWDQSRQNLVFLVADQVLFAYNIDSQTAVSPEKFPPS